MRCTLQLEKALWRQGYARVAGVDEAGRGSLFGPVAASAVILSPDSPIRGLNDSKLLTSEERSRLAPIIRERAAAWAVAFVDAAEIDRINILQASRLAMWRALDQITPPCDYILADAVSLDYPAPQRSLIKGDARVACIAAASILAKVERDAVLDHFDAEFPGYGLAHHKGYSTPEHLEALARLGPSPLHRRSYEPVSRLLQGELWR